MKTEKVWIVGERPRMISLLCTLLPTEQRAAFHSCCGKEGLVSAVYGVKDEYQTEGSAVELRSSYIPKGLRVELHESLEDCQCELLLLMFSFRFERYLRARMDALVKLICAEEKTPLHIKIILYDDPDIHTGVSDLEQSESELERMQKTVYQELEASNLQRIVEVIPYHEGDAYRLFLAGTASLCYSSDLFAKQLKDANLTISHFGSEYQIILYPIKNELDAEAIKNITKYSSVRNSNDLLRSYAENLLADNVWGQLMSKLGEEYHNCLSAIAFWDMDAEWERISECLRQKSFQFLIREQKAVRINGMSEFEYTKLLAEQKYDSKFSQNVSQLLDTEIPRWMQEEMKDNVSIYDAPV